MAKSFHILAASILALSTPLSAQPVPPPQLTLEQRTSLRCGAAFAIIADGQARGNVEAAAYPPLAERGREFFVRISARLMDETGMDRDAVAALVQREAQTLWDEGAIESIMPSCLVLLEASGV